MAKLGRVTSTQRVASVRGARLSFRGRESVSSGNRESGGVGGSRATFSSRILAEGNKMRINGFGESVNTSLPRSIFSQPGVQNTFRSTAFSEFGRKPQRSTETVAHQTFTSTSAGNGRPEVIHVIPSAPRAATGREFIQGLSAFQPRVSTKPERGATAENVKNSIVFSTTLPNRDYITPREPGVKSDKASTVRQRFITPTINTLAEEARRGAERSLNGNVPQNGVDSVRIVPLIGNEPPIESTRFAPREFSGTRMSDAQVAPVSTEQRIGDVVKKIREQQGPQLNEIKPFAPYNNNTSITSVELSDALKEMVHVTQAKDTNHKMPMAEKAKKILINREAKMAGILVITERQHALSELKNKVEEVVHTVSLKSLRAWGYVQNRFQEIGGYYELRLSDKVAFLYAPIKHSFWDTNQFDQNDGNLPIEYDLEQKLEKKKSQKGMLRKGNTQILPDGYSETDPILEVQLVDKPVQALQAQRQLVATIMGIQDQAVQISANPDSVVQHELHEPLSTVNEPIIIYFQAGLKEQNMEQESEKVEDDRQPEKNNIPELHFIVHSKTKKNRLEQVANGAAKAKKSPDGTVTGFEVADASEKFTPDSKSPLVSLLELLDGSEIAFWRHIMAIGSLPAAQWQKIAGDLNETFKPVAVRKEKGFSEEATIDDVNLVLNGTNQNEFELAA
jgi:hypothetical protein